jgi:hypothetical protein
MRVIDEIRGSKTKPKELVVFLAENVKKDGKLFAQLVDCLKNGSNVEKGVCAEVMEYVTKDKPELAVPYIDDIVGYINYDAPKVKWETARVVGNVAQRFPEKASKAVPRLLLNTGDGGTVVRWSAAYALTEIAKNNLRLRKKLVPGFLEIVAKEENSGVKNVYLKALKIIGK